MRRAGLRQPALLLAFVVIATAQTSDAVPAPPARPPPPAPRAASRQPLLQLQGRFSPGAGSNSPYARLPQLMTWSASAATATFMGSANVTVTLNGSLLALPAADQPLALVKGNFPSCAFQFSLNGTVVGTGSTSPSRPVLTWRMGGLSKSAAHTLTITKTTEAKFGGAWLTAIKLDSGGGFLPPLAPPAAASGRRLLFLGDSLSNGYGNIGNSTCSKAKNAEFENSLLAWPSLVAAALQADYQLVAWSGGGLSIYTAANRLEWPEELRPRANPKTAELFQRADAMDPASLYDLRAWSPQVVLLAAGINDVGGLSLDKWGQIDTGKQGAPALEFWLERYLALAVQIRQAYPAATLVHVVWPVEVLLGIRTAEQAAIYLQYMAAAYSYLEAAGIGNQHLLQVKGTGFNSSSWCGQHPDAAAHAQIAQQVTTFLDTVVL
ncbi:hypothetical protein ABPG75_007472 [Micractinium tetrahymenae]